MKKLLLIHLLLVVCCSAALAQAKFYKEALKRGTNSNGCYTILNPQNKVLDRLKMVNYLEKKGNFIVSDSTEEIHAFGNVVDNVIRMEFIPKDNRLTYVVTRLREDPSVHADQFKGSGAVYLASKREIPQTGLFYKRKYEVVYEPIENVRWTGSIKDGLINGKGAGIIEKTKSYIGKEYFYFEGTFSNGIPISDVMAKKVSTRFEAPYFSNNSIEKIGYMGVASTTILENATITDSKLSNALALQFKEWYKEDVKRIETTYQKTKNIGLNNLRNVWLNRDYGLASLVEAYRKANYDPNNILPKAQEILNVYTVVDAIYMKFREHYYSKTYEDYYRIDMGKLDNAKRLVSEGKMNSKYGFKNFYSQIESELEKKRKEFLEYVSNDNAWHQAQLAYEQRKEKEWRQKMCEDCMIDGKRTVFPEGYVEKWSFLLWSAPAQSKKDGVIYLKNGKKTTWKWIYKDYGTYISTDGFISDEFDTVDEMMNKIVETCKSYYCR